MLSNPKSINSTEVENFFKELDSFCLEQKSKKMVFFGIENICSISFSETYRAILDFEFSNLNFKNLLVSHLEAVEKYSPAAASYLPFFLNERYKRDYELNHESFFESSAMGTKEKILDIIDSFFELSGLFKPEDFKKMFIQNGFLSSFSVKRSNSFHNACVFESGMSIIGKTNSGFFKNNNGSVDIQNPQIIIYDGFIQEVSELNTILSFSYENKVPFLVICKGAAIDVLNTCFTNHKMDNCSVFIHEPNPNFWKDSLDDLLKAFDLEIFGSINGRLLSSYSYDKETECSSTIKQNEIFFKSRLLDLSKKAKTTIYLNEKTWKNKGIVFDQLNFFKSLLQQIATCGIIDSKKIKKIIGIDICDLTGLRCQFHPSFPVVRSLKEAEIVFNKIVNIGCLIKLEG